MGGDGMGTRRRVDGVGGGEGRGGEPPDRNSGRAEGGIVIWPKAPACGYYGKVRVSLAF